MPSSDMELMLATRQGDRNAFAELVRRHHRAMVNFFFRLLWDRQRAEDFAQEVFLRIYAHADTYEVQAKFTTFLYRVAKNRWIDYMRVEGHHPRSQSLDAPLGGEEGGSGADAIEGGGRRPDEVLMQTEAIREVQQAIEQLPEEHRLVILLSEQQGMKYQEISEVLGIPIGTVKSRMHNAILRLREILGVTIE